jgi:hypothetical protein
VVDASLPDGAYDAFVVAAESDRGAISIEVTITIGEHKGDVLRLRAERMVQDPIDLVGLPCTLKIDGGVPHLEW